VPRAHPDHSLHLLGCPRQHHGARKHAEVREAVTLISLQLALPGNQAVISHSGAQLGNVIGTKQFQTSTRSLTA
jgi:hypothetical protein